jgi:hypothetical protein
MTAPQCTLFVCLGQSRKKTRLSLTLFDKVASNEKSQGDYLFYSYPNAQISVASKIV